MSEQVPQERRVVTAVPGPKSVELQARRLAAVSSAVTSTLPVFVARGGGGILEDVDGNRLIDFGAGIAVVNVGNAAPRVVAAVQEQVAAFTHTCFMVNPYEGYVAVCEQLNNRVPISGDTKSFLANSGAEVVENAVKVARAATGRQAVVVFDHAYHGRTLLAMTLTAKRMPYKVGAPFAPEVYRFPMAYPYRWPTGPDNCAQEAAEQAISAIEKQIGGSNVAAVLVEPLLGEGGFIVPAEGFLPRIRQYCRDNGIVFIADEVQTGFGRTGTWFASEHEDLDPDLVTTAKGLGGGLPIGGLTGRSELMDAVHPGGLGGTFGGNPVACAAALAAIETIEAADLPGRARHIGEVMLPRLRALQEAHPVIGDVRGRGAMVAIELAGPDKTPTPDIATELMKRCHAEGLMVLKAGTYDNVLRFLPPLVMPDHLLDEGLTILEKAFASLG